MRNASLKDAVPVRGRTAPMTCSFVPGNGTEDWLPILVEVNCLEKEWRCGTLVIQQLGAPVF